MQTTISLKISQDLVTSLKKASKIRGLPMSDLIRPNLQNTFNRDSISHKEPEIFKYFGKYKNDDGIREFEKDLEKGRKGYKSKDLDL